MSDRIMKDPAKEVPKRFFSSQASFVMAWSLAALLCAMVGLSSYHFSMRNPVEVTAYNSVRLPPAGPVETTASIKPKMPDVEVYPLTRNAGYITSDTPVNPGQIALLKREIAALRRRLDTLTTQNDMYFKRLAALEKKTVPQHMRQKASEIAPPQSEAVKKHISPVVRKISPPSGTKRKIVSQTKIRPVFEKVSSQGPSLQKAQPASRDVGPALVIKDLKPLADAGKKIQAVSNVPVRLAQNQQHAAVLLPPVGDDESLTTGSINPATATRTPDPAPKPVMVTPGKAAGRSNGSGKAQIRRSDFAAIVGHYQNEEEAQNAWRSFVTNNAERMEGLRATIMGSELDAGALDLLVGPFANAADAAVACVKLLEITKTCRPTFFVGKPLPDFKAERKTARSQ